MYNCPVCGFAELNRPAENHLICPCCGTQFGYDDHAVSHEELRRQWLAAGARWWSTRQAPPAGWSALEQVERAKRSAMPGFASPVSSR